MKWPDADAVRAAASEWASQVASRMNDVNEIGLFGSYARGDWGVGSDLDMVVIVGDSGDLARQRALAFDVTSFPVPVDLLVYTESEWGRLKLQGMKRPSEEMIWLVTGKSRDLAHGPKVERKRSQSSGAKDGELSSG